MSRAERSRRIFVIGLMLGGTLVARASSAGLARGTASPPFAPAGSATTSSVEITVRILPSSEIPPDFALDQNYPNPFRASTVIGFACPRPSRMTLIVYDFLGRKVATLMDDVMGAGFQTHAWNGCDDEGRPLASGIYFYRMASGPFEKSRKAILLR